MLVVVILGRGGGKMWLIEDIPSNDSYLASEVRNIVNFERLSGHIVLR